MNGNELVSPVKRLLTFAEQIVGLLLGDVRYEPRIDFVHIVYVFLFGRLKQSRRKEEREREREREV